jgi:dTDP-4-amino-4,6-dideoxygalactose transaminase
MSPCRLAVWPTLPLGAHLWRASGWRPFPLDRDECRVYSLARHGLWNGCRALGLGAHDIVLAPAYHHGSEIEALLRAGLSIRYYELTETLEPDAGELESLLGPEVRALYLIHYLGFPQDAPAWRRWCRERGLFLIEDVAHGWLASVDGRPLGSFGDMAIFSFYKAVGVPEGGALVCSRPVTAEVQGGRGVSVQILRQLASRHEAWLTSKSSLAARLRDRSRARWIPSARSFRLGKVHAALSPAIPYLLPRLVEPDPAARRRRNYRQLLAELAGQVPPPLAALPDGASPYFFPIQTADKPGLLALLEEQQIDAVDFWALAHPSLPAVAFPVSAQFRASVVGVPVHQELRSRDLERIAAVLRRWAARPRAQRPPTVTAPHP